MNQSQRATTAGTTGYQRRFSGIIPEEHFRQSLELRMSSIGLGSYLGGANEAIDDAYRAAVKRAVELGCNVIDTAANYRFQRSERSIGEALAEMFSNGSFAREEIVVATKGGFIPFDNHQPRSRQEMTSYLEKTFIEPGVCAWDDFVQGSHCMTPSYLRHQIDQSRRNLKIECIDIYYIHNPETQLSETPRVEFYRRLRKAFEGLEVAVQEGKIAFYGTATWNGYRSASNDRGHLSLEQAVDAAREVAGEDHHFKVIQLPINLAMPEAIVNADQSLSEGKATILEAAAALGMTVMASASIMQSRLAAGLPPLIDQRLPGLRTDAQRAIQFTRSAPGVAAALVGMSSLSHVEENLELAKTPPASRDQFMKLFA